MAIHAEFFILCPNLTDYSLLFSSSEWITGLLREPAWITENENLFSPIYCNKKKKKNPHWWAELHRQHTTTRLEYAHTHTLTNRRSITSCSINRIRDDVFRSLTIFSIWLKYWSMRGYDKKERDEGSLQSDVWIQNSHYSLQWTARRSHVISFHSILQFSVI